MTVIIIIMLKYGFISFCEHIYVPCMHFSPTLTLLLSTKLPLVDVSEFDGRQEDADIM